MEAIGDICAVIQERYRQRQDLHRAELRLTLQIKAICRRLVRGDTIEAAKLYSAIEGKGAHDLCLVAMSVTAILWEARSGLQKGRIAIERDLGLDAKKLPIWPRVQATSGLGALGIASLIGETGDLRNYPTHSKLWKRLGLAVINGKAQQRVAGEGARQQGYSPERRSIVWTIGDSMFRYQSARVGNGQRPAKPPGPFRLGYDARKAFELANGLARGHAHNRAKRYMEKKLVRNIWRAWRDAPKPIQPIPPFPAA